MGLTFEIRALPTHLHVTVRGEFAEEDACDILTRVIEAAHNQPTLNILIDVRAAAGDPTLRQRFAVVTHAVQMRINSMLHGRPARYRTAIVGWPPLVHPNGYGARLLTEHNLKVAIFGTTDAAYAWLGIDRTRPPLPERGEEPGASP